MRKFKLLIIPFLLFVFGAFLQVYLDNSELLKIKLLAFGIIALLAFFALAFLPSHIIQQPTLYQILYIINLLLMLFAILFGTKIAGTKRWLYLGPVTYQPSEFFKFILVPILSFYLESQTYSEKRKLIITSILILIPTILTFLQPDAGTSIILFTLGISTIFAYISTKYPTLVEHFFVYSIFAILFLISLVFKWVFILLAIYTFLTRKYFLNKIGIPFLALVIMLPFMFSLLLKSPILKEYQQSRIKTYLLITQNKQFDSKLTDQEEYNFNLKQSRIAIGSGGILGKGLNNISQTRLRFLPEYKTDFMYATISEAFGLVGILAILGLYTTLIYIILSTKTTLHPELYLMKISIASLFIVEIIISIGSNLGLLPTKGIPLPFIGYGGTSLITHFMLLGLIANYESTT